MEANQKSSVNRFNYIALAGAFFMGCIVNNYIKNTSQESQGAIHPSKLEIQASKDIVTMRFQRTNYAIVLSKNGKPRFEAYEVKSVESAQKK